MVTFSKRVFLFAFVALALLYLLNLTFHFFFFGSFLTPPDFLEELMWLTTVDSALDLIWAPEAVLIAIFAAILLWFLAVFVPWIREIFGLIITPCTFPFEPEECLNNIDFQGKVEKEKKELSITSSGSGMLFKHYWRDFNAEFEFKFEGENGSPLKTSHETTKLKNEYCTKNNYLGFIFRARGFDNYFMLSIGIKKFSDRVKLVCEDNLKGKTLFIITPHVRVGGAWDVFIGEENPIEEVKMFNVSGHNRLIIQVKENVLKLWIAKPDEKRNQENQKVIIEERQPFFTWHLPTHYLINWGKEKEVDSHTPGDSSRIPFRNSIGRIGFRAYGDERFLIKNLTITKL